MYCKARVVTKDHKNITGTDSVAVKNLFFHTFIKNCVVRMNKYIVSDSQNTYAYKAFIEELLLNGEDKKKSEMSSLLFYQDDYIDKQGKKEGSFFYNRSEICKESHVFDMMGRISVPMFQQVSLYKLGLSFLYYKIPFVY